MSFQELKPTPIEISVTEADLPVVSSSVSEAERWLNSHVLVHSPPTKITKVVVGRGVLCNESSEPTWSSVLPSVKNLHSTLAKWGLLKETELSVALSSDCLDHSQSPSRFRGDAPKKILKPLLDFLRDCNLTYSIEQPSHSLVGDIVMKEEAKPMSRKLSSLSMIWWTSSVKIQSVYTVKSSSIYIKFISIF